MLLQQLSSTEIDAPLHRSAGSPTAPVFLRPCRWPLHPSAPSILAEVVDELVAECCAEAVDRAAAADAFACDVLVSAIAFSQGKYDVRGQVGGRQATRVRGALPDQARCKLILRSASASTRRPHPAQRGRSNHAVPQPPAAAAALHR